MIKQTNSNCKIISINIFNSTATIKCLFYSNFSTPTPQGFQFYFKDLENNMYKLSNTVYWVDRYIGTTENSTNISINKYKEVILTLDITNNFTSKLQSNRWVREGKLVLVNVSDVYLTNAWSSETLTLVSDTFEIASIKNITAFSTEDDNIHIAFDYNFTSSENFNYNAQNFFTEINIISLRTNKTLEQLIINAKDIINFKSSIVSLNTYTDPVELVIFVKNKNNQIIYNYRKIFKPFQKVSNTYVKTEEGIKKAITYFVKEQDNYYMQGTSTTKSKTIPTQQLKKSLRFGYNLNNAKVKLYTPSDIEVQYVTDNVDEEILKYLYIYIPNVENFVRISLDIYIEDRLFTSDYEIFSSEPHYIPIDSEDLEELEVPFKVSIKLSGYTTTGIIKLDIDNKIISSITVSENIHCNNNITINDIE